MTTALQAVVDRVSEIVKCCGMKMNVEKNNVNENLKRTIPSTYHDRSEQTGDCGVIKLLG
jgi:hypothetical protein